MIEWAKAELNRIAKDDEGMQDMINENILELIEVFIRQGHSGFSAPYVIHKFNRLANWKPISPLTGEEDEWGEASEDVFKTQQNKRCPSVFRDYGDNSTARDINGRVFSDDGGKSYYSSKGSNVDVKFPYIPKEKPEKVILKWGKKNDN